MLKKTKVNANVTNLRAILLLEADLNDVHKIMFNGRSMPKLEEQSSTSIEIIAGRRGKSAHHITMRKKLTSDI